MTSFKKVGANHANGRRSSGPKTATGRKNSRHNATKAIDNSGVGEVSPKEFCRRLRRHEEQLSEHAFKWLQTQFANQRFFSYPLFEPPHPVSDESRELLSDPASNITLFSYCCEIAEPVGTGCLSLQPGCTWRTFANQKIC